MRTRSSRGYALPTVLGILALIAISLSVLLSVISNTARTSGDMLKRRKSFYACDGMQRSIISLGNNYLRSTDAPDPVAMKTSIESQAGGAGLPSIMEAGYTLTNFDVNFDPNDVTTGPLPSGPFVGMNARQTPIAIELEAQLGGTNIKCGQSLEVSLAQIGLFQFLAFYDVNLSVAAGTASFFNGRLHSNADICLEGSGVGAANTGTLDRGPYLSRLTSAGEILHAQDARCVAPGGQSGNVAIPDGDPASAGTTWIEFRDDSDSGCTNCNGSGLSWLAYAQSTWNGRVLDSAHNVPDLRLPVAASAETQAGYNARISPDGVNLDALQSNAGTARFLIDPPRAADSGPVRTARLACQSDIRIVDGVWYVRPASPADNCGFPGIPIWSDHTANATDPAGNLVGQNQLNASRGWGGNTPTRYSYYERGNLATSPTITPNADGIVSYGVLAGSGANATRVYEPGSLAVTAEATNCESTAPPATGLLSANAASAAKPDPSCVPYALVQGARSGFRNGHALANGHNDRANILPMNFDVGAFQDALADNAGNGELGDYFPAAGDFNGIIYITNTWAGSANGFPNLNPTPPPTQNGAPNSGELPRALCSDGPVPNLSDSSGTNGNTTVAADCTDPDPTIHAYPNALRIINGRNVHFDVGVPSIAPNQLPEGLSIVTNIPFYILGDLNLSSQARTPNSTQWVPVAVWGDAGHLLSNAWDDGLSRWDTNVLGNTYSRCAVQTTYNTAMFTGLAVGFNGNFDGSIVNLPKFLEAWRNGTCGTINATVTGSFVVGHSPVYAEYSFAGPLSGAYDLPVRDWQFDSHFSRIDNQPPGTPVFDVSAMRRWSRF